MLTFTGKITKFGSRYTQVRVNVSILKQETRRGSAQFLTRRSVLHTAHSLRRLTMNRQQTCHR